MVVKLEKGGNWAIAKETKMQREKKRRNKRFGMIVGSWLEFPDGIVLLESQEEKRKKRGRRGGEGCVGVVLCCS